MHWRQTTEIMVFLAERRDMRPHQFAMIREIRARLRAIYELLRSLWLWIPGSPFRRPGMTLNAENAACP
jgi:hypothetical protein